jgi:hypothetical protein
MAQRGSCRKGKSAAVAKPTIIEPLEAEWAEALGRMRGAEGHRAPRPEMARVSVWIGEIQWMRRNGFPAATNPILRPLETVECRDAVLVLRDEASTGSASPQADRRRSARAPVPPQPAARGRLRGRSDT